MSLRRDVRHGVRIGRAEFVRSRREYLQDNRRILGFVVVLLFLGGNLLFALPGVFLLGRTAQSASAIPFLGPAASVLPVGLVLFAALRTVERISGVEGESLLLTSVHPRAVVVGLLVAEIARLALWFGLPLVLVAAVFAAGLGAPGLLVTGTLVVFPLACCAAVWGYALGLAALRGLRRLPTLRRFLKGASVLLFVGVIVASQFVGQYFATVEVSLESLLSVLSVAPVVEYVALAFVGTPLSQPVAPRSAFVLLGVLGLTPVGLFVAERQATALWFTDAPRSGSESERSVGDPESASRETGVATRSQFSPPKPFAWTAAGRVAWGVLVRAVRKPQELVHLLTIAFVAGPFLGTVTQTGLGGEAAPLFAAGLGVVLGAYLSGAAFGLNPLGDDRPQFPLLLLTETSPRTYVDGRAVAGLAVGLPVAVVVPLLALAVGGSPLDGVAFALAGVAACLAATLFALGLGCLYPIYDAREVWGTETVSPSTLITMVFTFVVVGGASVGVFALWFALTGNLRLTAVAVVGLAVYLALTAGVPLLSYRYAVRRYRRFVLD